MPDVRHAIAWYAIQSAALVRKGAALETAGGDSTLFEAEHVLQESWSLVQIQKYYDSCETQSRLINTEGKKKNFYTCRR